MASPVRSLCFREAYDLRVDGQIPLEEFLKHIVAHYGGLRHETDVEGHRSYMYAGFEDEVREIVLGKGFQPLDEDDIALLNSVFLGAYEKDFATVQNLLKSSTLALEMYLVPLVEIARETGDSRLLRFCLEKGYEPTGYNTSNGILSCRVKKNPSTEWLDVLYDFNFRQWRTDREKLNKRETWQYVLNMGPDCVHWWIDHGGRTPSARDLFFDYKPSWPGKAALQILLDQFGIGWFRNSGTLQIAVKKHDFETVQMLVEAGADVNEWVEEWGFDVREHRQAPLAPLYEAVYGKSEKMIRYLVDHGAKLPRRVVEDPYDLKAQEFKPFKQLVVELNGVAENDDAVFKGEPTPETH